MKIWLVAIGEPLPTDGNNERLLRMGILANLLVARGQKNGFFPAGLMFRRSNH
ncbi:MAG: hypothetical protein K6U80_11060 [Firmicutes bacterium]|nr:hypothetical protein [Bacillota bacterium]